MIIAKQYNILYSKLSWIYNALEFKNKLRPILSLVKVYTDQDGTKKICSTDGVKLHIWILKSDDPIATLEDGLYKLTKTPKEFIFSKDTSGDIYPNIQSIMPKNLEERFKFGLEFDPKLWFVAHYQLTNIIGINLDPNHFKLSMEASNYWDVYIDQPSSLICFKFDDLYCLLAPMKTKTKDDIKKLYQEYLTKI